MTSLNFPAWCVTDPFKPTFYDRDAGTSLLDCRPPAPALTEGGCWEQLKPGEATHLPFRAGYNWVCTAKVGKFPAARNVRLLFYIHYKPFVCKFSVTNLEKKQITS